MRLEVERRFELPYPGPPEAAVAFLRDVARSLALVPFIRDLSVNGAEVEADLVVNAPLLGEQRLDFHSRLEPRPDGADLLALEREGRAWAAVSGEGRAAPSGEATLIEYRLRVVVHLDLPAAEKWGGRAFEKMARATAERTLERVTDEFPSAVRAAMP